MGWTQSRPTVTARDRAILDLKVQRDRLRQYTIRIQRVMHREKQIALEQLRSGNRDKAMLALKMKKHQEGLLVQSSNQLLNLDQLVSSIEFAMVERQVVEGLRRGNALLKELQQEMSLELVENLMLETAESIEYQNAISRALASKLDHRDEEDIEREYEAIWGELQGSIDRSLPDAPRTAKEAAAAKVALAE